MTPGVVAGEFEALERTLDDKRQEVELALRGLLRPGDSPAVAAAMADSLCAPAKRLRPVLALMVADALKGDAASILPAACAVEFVHTASLILDDLPSMDDARTRRGRPACHVAHGEANALLAAFALLNRAYEIVAEGWAGGPDATQRAGIARELAQAVGTAGLIAGQAADVALTEKTFDFGTLEFIHSRKTGALFMVAAAIGAAATRASATEQRAIRIYAKNLGLAFQVVDDLLDAEGRASEAGKDVGQDLKKTTFVSFSGVEGARQLARELIVFSQDALAAFGPRAAPLRDLARYVVARRR